MAAGLAWRHFGFALASGAVWRHGSGSSMDEDEPQRGRREGSMTPTVYRYFSSGSPGTTGLPARFHFPVEPAVS